MDSAFELILFQEQEEVPVPLRAEEEGVEEGPDQRGGGGGQGAGGGQEQEAGELLYFPLMTVKGFLKTNQRTRS